jgi:hypothetical protein
MICNSCVITAIGAAAIIAALVLLAFGIVRTIIGVILLAAVVGLIALCLVANESARIGAALGLLLGTLLGPARIAGVDFRQWFIDPGSPSEIGDDSFIGLMRWGFHSLWAPCLLAIVALVCSVSSWMDPACHVRDVSPFLHDWLDPTGLDGLVLWLSDVTSACSGFHAGLNVVLGTVFGVLIVPALVELAWCIGLSRGVPPPSAVTHYLAPHPLPRVRDKEEHKDRRRLIICCDGTWNWPEAKRETNVVRMVRSLLPDDNGITQIIHYHQGVGTGNFLDRVVGGGAGVGLSASVKACYGFLADNYNPHDEIFLFGFSRGAFVMRSLAGMIGAVGMLRKHQMAQFAEVWNWYCLGKEKRERRSLELEELARGRYCDVDIECVGVWDTVGALGIPGSRLCAQTFQFHDTSLGTHVRHAFQALAIDERRGNFQGAVWVPWHPTQQQRRTAHGAAAAPTPAPTATAERTGPQQVLRQMWFPGVHSNIGGGYPKHGLSDASFLWMIAQLQGLLGFDNANILRSLDDEPAERYPVGKLQDSRTFGWKLIACPVPRPVAVISATERVHASALGRSFAGGGLVSARDVYRSARRREWLGAIGPEQAVSDFEQQILGLNRPGNPPQLHIRRTLGFCGWILAFITGKG